MGPGPGVAWPKSRCLGCEPAALATESFPRCPPGPLAWAAGPRGVGLEPGEDGVADAALEGAEGFFAGNHDGTTLVGTTGRPACLQAAKPPSRSVALRRPSRCKVAAARLD